MICGTVADIDLCPVGHISELALAAVVSTIRLDMIGICNDTGEHRSHLRTGQALIQHHITGLVSNHDTRLTQVGCGGLLFSVGSGGKGAAGHRHKEQRQD